MKILINKKTVFFILFMTVFGITNYAQDTIALSNDNSSIVIGKQIKFFLDSNNKYNASNILLEKDFIQSDVDVPIFSFPIKSLWCKFTINNKSDKHDLILSVKDPNLSQLLLYEYDSSNELSLLNKTGTLQNFYERQDENVDFNFYLNIPLRTCRTYYIKLSSVNPVELRMILYNNNASFGSANFIQNLIIGIYCGIIIATFFYNLFIYFSTRDKSYLIYVLYLLTLGFALITFAGWSFKLFWPEFPVLNKSIVIITSCLSGIMGIAFAKSFLDTSSSSPRLNKILSIIVLLYFLAIALSFTSLSGFSFIIFNISGILASIIVFYLSIVLYRGGYRPALFYLIAWSIFIVGLIIYLLKNLNLVATNNFTHYILFFGSAIEVVLLSIALADKINAYKREKEISQAQALRVAKENEVLIREQNIVLEQQVSIRTKELSESNTQLNEAIISLKDAQAQLVDAEKMASLGQLTAGIAHEINNPINFVKSNINPLRLDINDIFELIEEYNSLHNISDDSLIKSNLKKINKLQEDIDLPYIKSEISNLVRGIEDGAERTAEIVRGLRTFSRLDEGSLKRVNLHEGIESTLGLLKSSFPYNIKVRKNFKAKGDVECFSGKINQVFMNILNNALQAIKAKRPMQEEEFIDVETRDTPEGFFQVSIRDTGIGMSEEIQQHIFEPFFTTKDVGEGTGLGMAIVFKIIQQHQGKIEIHSQLNVGSEFILTLPHIFSTSEQTK